MNQIHPTAVIDPAARLGEDVEIGPYVVIEGPAVIGDRVRLLAHVHIHGHTEMGDDCQIHPFAVIGGPPQDYSYTGERSFCRIGPRTVIRESATIHVGTGPESSTVVGADCMLMAYAHVAHNCHLGDHVTLINAAGLAGHVHVGNYATLSGRVLVHQFVRIGEHTLIGGSAGLSQDAVPFMMYVKRNQCFGVNRVGLRRRGFREEELAELKMLHSRLLRHAADVKREAAEIQNEVRTEPGKRLIDFVLTNSKRGICMGRKHDDHPEEMQGP